MPIETSATSNLELSSMQSHSDPKDPGRSVRLAEAKDNQTIQQADTITLSPAAKKAAAASLPNLIQDATQEASQSPIIVVEKSPLQLRTQADQAIQQQQVTQQRNQTKQDLNLQALTARRNDSPLQADRKNNAGRVNSEPSPGEIIVAAQKKNQATIIPDTTDSLETDRPNSSPAERLNIKLNNAYRERDQEKKQQVIDSNIDAERLFQNEKEKTLDNQRQEAVLAEKFLFESNNDDKLQKKQQLEENRIQKDLKTEKAQALISDTGTLKLRDLSLLQSSKDNKPNFDIFA